MKAIVCADFMWGIGCKGKILINIPEDRKHFKEMTENKTVIMGRKTFDEINKPLSNRTNIVLSRDESWYHEGVIHFSSIEKLLEFTKTLNNDEIFVIGGQSIYDQLLQYCDEIFLTKILKTIFSDRFFYNLNVGDHYKNDWVLKENGAARKYEGTTYYKFCTYARK